MCYSAMVEQNAKIHQRLFSFPIREQIEKYEDLFSRRLEGEKLYLNKAMEKRFTLQPETAREKAIAAKILAWHEQQIPELEQDLFAQKKRLATAERALAEKVTKKAENEKRVSTDKIAKLKFDLERHHSKELLSETEERIFPGHYFSLLCLDEKGEAVVQPARYLYRPHDKDESFDRKFHGCYNARLDSLDRVAWWKNALGRRHGVMLVRKFYENVATEDYARKHKLPAEAGDKKSLVLCFQPDGVEYMFIPVLWDQWEGKGQPGLCSAALITDEPAPEVAAAGHDRTPIFLKKDAVEDWLRATGRSVKELMPVLSRIERPHYSHRLIFAA
jgi:putative SOS response-associated peptidase YedK